MKTQTFWIAAMLFVPLSLLAADAVTPPATGGNALNLLNLLITGLTPIVILGIKKIVPDIPKWLLPLSAPVIGIGIDFVLRKAGLETGGAVSGALYGAAGTWLREFQDQVRQAAGLAGTTKP